MKKFVTTLLLTLAMLLVLCLSAMAAQPSLSGTLGDGGQLSWQLENGALSVQLAQAGQSWTGQVMAACYQNGRFSQVKVLTPDKPAAQVGDQVNLVKLFWLGEGTYAPQCEPAQAAVMPDKVFTDGIARWGDLTNPNSDHFVADFYTRICTYGLNGVDQETEYYLQPTDFADAIAKRGAVSEFFVNEHGLIYRVNCYDYTVTKLTGNPATRSTEGVLQVQLPGVTDGWVDAELVTGYEDLVAGDVVLYYTTPLPDGGARYTLERPSGKVTGKIFAYSQNGQLDIQGTRYRATELTVKGCALPVSTQGFGNWAFEGGSFDATYDFYLDRSGSICWIDQWEDGDHQVCVLLSARHDADGLQVDILTAGGKVKTIPVTRLDGKTVVYGNGAIDGAFGGGGGGIADSADLSAAASDTIVSGIAVQQLNLNRQLGKAFYTYHTLASGGYGLVLADKASQVNTGFTWGENYAIPQGSAIQPDADFTSGAIPCKADGQTRFLLAVGDRERKEYRTFVGSYLLPYTQASGYAIAGADGVAECVYLDVPHFAVDPPDGYILISSNDWMVDPDLYEEDVYLVNIVDTDGTTCHMRVPAELKDWVSYDNDKLNSQADTIFKFWAVKEIDENGVVSALGDKNGRPAELSDVTAMGRDFITLSNGKTYSTDTATRFVYVDLGWEDGDSVDNCIGVREPDKDIWRLSASGTFYPEDFFDPNEVDATGAYDLDPAYQNPNGVPYISVQAAVIPSPDDDTLADWVYVLRRCW